VPILVDDCPVQVRGEIKKKSDGVGAITVKLQFVENIRLCEALTAPSDHKAIDQIPESVLKGQYKSHQVW
jgi:hypothetical protein